MGDFGKKATDFVGLTDHEGQEKARDEANRQSKRSYSLTKDEIDFQRKQYNDWKGIYGPLQEDIGTYFKNLTGDNLAAQQITQIQAGSQEAQRRTDQVLAQRGLTGSGLEAQALMQNTFGTEMQKANVRANSEQVAAQQQMNFLGLGLGQGAQMLGTQAGVSNTGANVAGSQASSALNVGASLSQSNTKAMADLYGTILAVSQGGGSSGGFGGGSGGGGGGSLISSVIGAFSDKRLKDNIKPIETLNGITFYSWDWNDIANNLGYQGSGFGVIAQEVQDIIPNSVSSYKGYLTVDYEIILKYVKETK